jgi:hypothetical protein
MCEADSEPLNDYGVNPKTEMPHRAVFSGMRRIKDSVGQTLPHIFERDTFTPFHRKRLYRTNRNERLRRICEVLGVATETHAQIVEARVSRLPFPTYPFMEGGKGGGS